VLPGAIPHVERNDHTYQPLPSVWDGEDAVLLEQMLGFFPVGSRKEFSMRQSVGGGSGKTAAGPSSVLILS
jgi:hypothetical protein